MARTLLVAACALLLTACGLKPRAVTLLQGTTMGSAWTVKIAGHLPADETALRDGVQGQFDAVDAALSTWRADSALSAFNDAKHADWQTLDPELFAVLRQALQLAALSDGAYDVTIAPLVDLWGFGPAPKRDHPPTAHEIESARARVGWRQIELDADAQRARRPVGVRVDLSSLGKGRGVDRVADWLQAQGVHHFLIDLSGKLRASGVNADAQPWRVAVEQPVDDDPSGAPSVTDAVTTLRDEAIATAGDYRRYFESDGQHLSHLIDPVSGWPVDHGTGSATARLSECMQADAWATLFTLMPASRAVALADAQGIPALVIVRREGRLQLLQSKHWRSEH